MSVTITADDLHAALMGGQLSLAYQPIVDLTTGEPRGIEALMRWNHPVHGAIPPSVFIPVAEESGLIVQASRWALREACAALKRIIGKIGYDASLFVSVNFSANDFADENFLEQIYSAISATDIHPALVRLEITERLLKANPEQARQTIALCRRAGLSIAIDDFSTESSSLAELQGYGIYTVKIDDIKDERIRSIINEAHDLGMSTIAEGVETEEEAITLRAMGCEKAQGYYFARPMPEAALIETLQGWHRQSLHTAAKA